MADSNPKDINTVNNINNIDANDYLFVSDQGSALRKVNSNAVSKYAVETYNGTSLGGSNKTVQAAINDLISNCTAQQLSNADLNTLTSPNKVYYAAGGNNCTNVPTGVGTFGLKIVRVSAGYIRQVLTSTSNEVFARQYDGTTWSDWRKNPTRPEIEEINGKLPFKGTLPTNTDLLTVTDPGIYLVSGSNAYVNSPSAYGMLEVISHVKNLTNKIRILRITTVNAIWIRYITSDTVTGTWVKMPTREEVDALNNKHKYFNSTETDRNTAIHNIVSSIISNYSNGDAILCTLNFSGSLYCGFMWKGSATIMFGRFYRPNANGGFYFRDATTDSSATSTDFS